MKTLLLAEVCSAPVASNQSRPGHLISWLFLLVLFCSMLSAIGQAAAGTLPKDCSSCPTMVRIPAGKFKMGSSLTHFALAFMAKPPHWVTVKAFALARYAVTRGEFAEFVRETGFNPHSCYRRLPGKPDRWPKWVHDPNLSWRNPGFPQTDRDPVVCVSLDDAQHYLKWLSKKAGREYRLPTEAEWEYAARAGTTALRYWGGSNKRACKHANVGDNSARKWTEVLPLDLIRQEDKHFPCSDKYEFTAPVGSFPPNAFGLYDMLGNALQWVQDCDHKSYDGAPSDGSAWMTGDCKKRIRRGGSWAGPVGAVTAVSRLPTADERDFLTGFRVARSLTP